jgi:hypothetical protein
MVHLHICPYGNVKDDQSETHKSGRQARHAAKLWRQVTEKTKEIERHLDVMPL